MDRRVVFSVLLPFPIPRYYFTFAISSVSHRTNEQHLFFSFSRSFSSAEPSSLYNNVVLDVRMAGMLRWIPFCRWNCSMQRASSSLFLLYVSISSRTCSHSRSFISPWFFSRVRYFPELVTLMEFTPKTFDCIETPPRRWDDKGQLFVWPPGEWASSRKGERRGKKHGKLARKM